MAYRFITHDRKNNNTIVWCTTAGKDETYFNFIQYVLDSCNAPEEYMIMKDNGVCYDMLGLATDVYKMRPRTFEERMNDIKTGVRL